MAARRDSFRIVRIRFVNFHNLGTGIVNLPGGGHLFLLGDNGSGKTTLLDAIHYVLSAGDIEFNAAARVAGAKGTGGRKVQGVVMRYNVEAGGPMNRNGGISYAALELASPETGKTISVCIGLSAEDMDVAYDSWGGMADAPVADLPLVVEEDGRARAARREEFARRVKSLPGGRYHAKIGQYADAIAERFFDDRETYRNVCRILATGKAYREIASKAGNLDALFRQLLEEPGRDTFTELVDGLRSIDECRERLDHLESRLGYLRKLSRTLDEFRRAKENILCAQWRRAALDAECAESDARRLESERLSASSAIEAAKESLAAHARERASLQAEAQELKAKDASGLLAREKQLAQEADALGDESEKRETASAAAKDAAAVAARLVAERRRELADGAAKRAVALHKAGAGLPVSVIPAVSALDAAAKAERPEEAALDAAAMREGVAASRDEAVASCAERRLARDNAATDEARLAKELSDLESMPEPEPSIPGFAAARSVANERLFKATPLYLHVEPHENLKPVEVAAFEQVIGDELLGTWLVDADEADAVRMEFFRNHREQSIFVRTDDFSAPAETDWVVKFVDVAASDPDAVNALKAGLAARSGLKVQTAVETKIAVFRGRERPLLAAKPRLLGARQRREEQARRIRAKREECAAAAKARSEAERLLRTAEESLARIRALEALLAEAEKAWASGCADVRLAKDALAHREEAAAHAAAEAGEARVRLERTREQLESVRLKMKSEGVSAALEGRIRAVERRLRETDAKIAHVHEAIGGAKSDIARLDGDIARSRARRLAAEESRAATEKSLLGVAALAAERLGDAAASRDALERFLEEAKHRETELETTLKRDIRDPAGLDYAFRFDPSACSLIDQRGEALRTILENETRQFDDQKSLIDDKTRRLFRDIFVADVLRRLYEDDQRLTQLSVKINRMLKDRYFGSTRYSFDLKPVPQYESLLAIVRKYSAYGAGEDGEEISEFVEAHRDAILGAQPGEIPELFDYRQWYEFQLKMVTRDNEGRIIDRSVKSVGSGGEQAVPNYLLVLTVAAFLYQGRAGNQSLRLQPLLFDEAFYGIDSARRDQLLSFAHDLGLQLFVASPDQDGVKRELPRTTSLFVVKDEHFDVHLYRYDQDITPKQGDIFSAPEPAAPAETAFKAIDG